jgi:Vitamin K-dependent gamma-carboxylase
MNLYNPLRRDYWFGQVDTRPLSLFRIFFAAILLKSALYFVPLAQRLYSDSGVIPRSTLLAELARPDRFSLMDALSAPWMAALFFLLWAGVAVGLLVGYRTRLMTVLNFVFLLSVQERNIYVLNGADYVLRVLSFWCLFLPLGHYYSIDAVLTRVRRFRQSANVADLRVTDNAHTTFAFPWRMIQIQFALIYVVTAALKVTSAQWWGGEATYYALQIQSLTLPTGEWLLAHGPLWLFQIASAITLLAECLFVILVFLPVLQPAARLLGIAMVALLHIGIMVTFSIADFSAVMLAGYVLFFDPRWVKWLDNRLRARRGPLYVPPPAAPDDPLWLLLAATSDTEIVIGRATEQRPIMPDQPQQHARPGILSDALSHLPLSRLWIRTLRAAPVYALFWQGSRWVICHSPLHTPVARAESPARIPSMRANAAGKLALVASLSCLMVGVIWTNALTLNWNDEPLMTAEVPEPLRTTINYTGLWQSWNMFAPYPANVDGWIVMPAEFEDGTTFDLRTGQPPSDVMPRLFFGPELRWRKLEDNLARYGDEPILRDWARSYCIYYNITLNRPTGQRLSTFKIIYRSRASHAFGEPPNPLQDRLLWTHYCYDQP